MQQGRTRWNKRKTKQTAKNLQTQVNTEEENGSKDKRKFAFSRCLSVKADTPHQKPKHNKLVLILNSNSSDNGNEPPFVDFSFEFSLRLCQKELIDTIWNVQSLPIDFVFLNSRNEAEKP